jgi:hypothetical protein
LRIFGPGWVVAVGLLVVLIAGEAPVDDRAVGTVVLLADLLGHISGLKDGCHLRLARASGYPQPHIEIDDFEFDAQK